MVVEAMVVEVGLVEAFAETVMVMAVLAAMVGEPVAEVRAP